MSALRGQGVGLPTVKVSFWPGVRILQGISAFSERFCVLEQKYKDFSDARVYSKKPRFYKEGIDATALYMKSCCNNPFLACVNSESSLTWTSK